MFRHGTLFVLLAFICLGTRAEDCPADKIPTLHEEARLHKDLFCAYDFKEIRPVKDHKTTITVKVRLALKYLNFDAQEETFTLHSWVPLTWKDEFLTWEPKDYGGVKELQLRSDEFWTPRMSLFNADVTMMESDSLYTTCTVSSQGIVMCVPHVTHSGICRTTLRKWPYDKQNCTLYFGSWMHTGEQINFTFFEKSPIIQNEFENGPGWHLDQVTHKRLPGNFGNSSYPMLKYTFSLSRVAAGPAAIVVVPSVVIVILTMVSMLLDINNNTRLVMICFALFGHFMFLTEIGYNIPKHSADTPIILLFLRDSMVVTLVCICETLVLMSLRKKSHPAPTWIVSLNRLVNSGPGKYVVFTEFDPSDATGEVKVLADEAPEEKPTNVDWLQFANILNSFLFIVCVLTYLILVLAYIPNGTFSSGSAMID